MATVDSGLATGSVEVLPNHKQLPDSDGKPVENFQENPQGRLLTGSLWPVLERLHPDGQFAVGQNSGIYYHRTQPPLDGCKAPDWFYVPNVPPMLEGEFRRSYVLWQELVRPLIVMEFVSGDGTEERDPTPPRGKFWVYEQAIRAAFYVIFEPNPGRIEVYQLVNDCYQRVAANERGHYPIEPLGVELGIWEGTYLNQTAPWMRCWDLQGNFLLATEEREDRERQRAEQEKQRAEQEKQRANHLAAKLRSLGIDPDQL